MPVFPLTPKAIEKVWGRADLPQPFGSVTGDEQRKIGEIWFEASDSADLPLLVKYLFTSERLSIQVHPDAEHASLEDCPRGKDEAWWILDAEADARIAIGFKAPVEEARLRAAALDGSIVDLVEWVAPTAGQFIFSPAGTVHAIGAGLALIEIQQNCGITYRLHDYGRPRKLHLDRALTVARREPYTGGTERRELGGGRTILTSGGAFIVELWRGRSGPVPAAPDAPVWLIPLKGDILLGDPAVSAGEVWLADEPCRVLMPEEGEMLLAYAGPEILDL